MGANAAILPDVRATREREGMDYAGTDTSQDWLDCAVLRCE